MVANQAGLPDRLPAFFDGAEVTVSQKLEASLSTLFTEFSTVPAVVASITQVHFAVTTVGEPVAEALRPGVERQFERNLSLFAWEPG